MNSFILIIVDRQETNAFYAPLFNDSSVPVRYHTGMEGIETLLHEGIPALVLLDYQDNNQIPVICERLAGLSEMRGVPILICVPEENIKDISLLLSNRADDYIIKPVDQDGLKQKIGLWIRLSTISQSQPLPDNGPVLWYYLNISKRECENGNFGFAKTILENIWGIVVLMKDKEHIAWHISKAIAKLSSLTAWGKSTHLLDEMKEIDLAPPNFMAKESPVEKVPEQEHGEVPSTPEKPKSEEPIPSPKEYSDVEDDISESKVIDQNLTGNFQLADYISPQEASDIKDQFLKKTVEEGKESFKVILKKKDLPFVIEILKNKLISPEDLAKYIEKQKTLELSGKKIWLSDIMLGEGALSIMDIQDIFGKDALITLYCGKCNKSFQYLKLKDKQQNFHCQSCKEEISTPLQDKIMSEEEEELGTGSSTELRSVPKVSKGNIPRLMEKARAWYQRKIPEKAIFWYTRVIDLDPTHLEAFTARSKAYLDTKDYLRALVDAEKALEINPSCHKALHNRGIARYYCHYLEEAIADMTALIHCDLFPFTSYSTRGKAYFRKKDYHKAIEDLSKALNLRSNFFKGYFYRGQAYAAIGDDENAIIDLKKALKLSPETHNSKDIEKMIELSQMRIVSRKLKASRKAIKQRG